MSNSQEIQKLSVELDDCDVDVIRYALTLLDRDLKFDIETYARHDNLDAVSQALHSRSVISFLLNKIHF